MRRVLFFCGQSRQIADIFCGMKPAGFDVFWHPHSLGDNERTALIKDIEFLVLHPAEISANVLREAKCLRLIQLLTAGYDKIDLHLAKELGIPVATNGGANSWSVAEHAVALLLALYKRLVHCDKSVREGTWRKPVSGFNTFEAAGKTAGLIGMGNIAKKVARRLKAFETNIIYYDIKSAPDIEAELGARKVSLDELLREADIITIHVPLLKETRALIGKREISLMKPTTVIINTSRGEIVDEKALISALKEKRIAGAGLDVFGTEPVEKGNPVLDLDNVVLSPHTAGHSYEGWFRRSSFAWENIQRAAAGQAPLSLAFPESQ